MGPAQRSTKRKVCERVVFTSSLRSHESSLEQKSSSNRAISGKRIGGVSTAVGAGTKSSRKPPRHAHSIRSSTKQTDQNCEHGFANVSSKPVGTKEFIISEVLLLEAVDSLYDDELKPYGRILRKRMLERFCVGAELDLCGIKEACERSSRLMVVPENGGEWCTLLKSRVSHFVDIYSAADHYPESMWEEAALYFESLVRNQRVLPGGRYACAQDLHARNLECLKGRSLGQVCHIVQLALSSRKILGYSNGAITPYADSLSKKKDCAAEMHSSCKLAAGGSSQLRVATWEMVRRCLREILATATTTEKPRVPLSRVKRLFQSRFQLELSETALGHSKLSELLQDERLCDTCSVKLLEQGYFVEPVAACTRDMALGDDLEPRSQLVRGTGTGHSQLDIVLHEDCSKSDRGLSLRSSRSSSACTLPSEDLVCRTKVHNTFIHAVMPASPNPVRHRSQSLPRSMGSAIFVCDPGVNHKCAADATPQTQDWNIGNPASPLLTASPIYFPAKQPFGGLAVDVPCMNAPKSRFSFAESDLLHLAMSENTYAGFLQQQQQLDTSIDQCMIRLDDRPAQLAHPHLLENYGIGVPTESLCLPAFIPSIPLSLRISDFV